MEKIIQKIRADLKSNSDKVNQKSFQRFFKEKVKCYGVKTGVVGKIANKYWKEVADSDKKEIFKLCEALYRSDYCEEAFIVSWWAPKLADKFEPKDFALFKKWIEKYINNWAKCDGFCNHTIGDFIEKYPRCIEELKKWTKSKNRWMRRAAAVSLIVPAKEGKFLKDVFEITDLLLLDKDDMVQKGYGWLLKEASRLHQKEVFDFIVKNKKKMPRTALRYAIELMPKNLKAEAMKLI
ncbi:MAG: DNA alkylation repair protein [Candidatus Nealsonbacteria bacterium CG_4_10_14_0_2_um_filter_38_17]|uniref:DNA alkylation repair protein n=1 Tax=Candidatus Nealsonbacteria bacterium CG_4_10_14_0_2_um_filter_38_17 TaxID=1974680 RepID=A0A2M7UXL9_9BACT|nr:MAG: DNA alkylation repair protein [Candidatus Nealsonbacteria bacterium CG_4_10_14_0_2_um_filter_38_17]